MARRAFRLAVTAALALIGSSAPLLAQPKKSDAFVKVSAKGDKAGADGKQTVTVTIQIDKGWHIYANPAGCEELETSKTVVKVTAKERLLVKVDYPAGKLVELKELQIAYRIYEGKVDIKAHVQRVDGDTGPLEVSVRLRTVNDRMCVLPATVKVPVE